MGKNQRDGVMLYGLFDNLPGRDSKAVHGTLKKVGGLDNLIPAVQVDNLVT